MREFCISCNHILIILCVNLLSCCSYVPICCSDRFLPDKAIDLIDEAGSRVRLQHAQVNNLLTGFCIYLFHGYCSIVKLSEFCSSLKKLESLKKNLGSSQKRKMNLFAAKTLKRYATFI